tara:strand:+ start:41 stop:217 length:177 start_codon:yes stop_codon:yes gene_type:complete
MEGYRQTYDKLYFFTKSFVSFCISQEELREVAGDDGDLNLALFVHGKEEVLYAARDQK